MAGALPGCAAPLYVVLTTKPGDPRQQMQRARSASDDDKGCTCKAPHGLAGCKSMQCKIWTNARQSHNHIFSLFNLFPVTRSRYNKARAASCCITHALLISDRRRAILGSRPRETSKGATGQGKLSILVKAEQCPMLSKRPQSISTWFNFKAGPPGQGLTLTGNACPHSTTTLFI